MKFDWNFVDEDDAKAEIRAAVQYLLRGATGGEHGDIVQEIITIVRNAASEFDQIPWTTACPTHSTTHQAGNTPPRPVRRFGNGRAGRA